MEGRGEHTRGAGSGSTHKAAAHAAVRARHPILTPCCLLSTRMASHWLRPVHVRWAAHHVRSWAVLNRTVQGQSTMECTCRPIHP